MVKELKNSELIVKQLDKIIERFRKYIPVGEVEKKSFGEVFTPFKLINEMLDTLPEEVWSNPNLKWADLCNGMGSFLIVIVQRLMNGLRQWEPNENKRYKHIIENMIYAAELQPKNMFLWILSVDPKSKLKLNVYTGNSLSKEFDEHMKNEWKVEKFDIIVGNPPYQEQKEGNKKTQPLWHLFVERYILLLSSDGYMTIVHPSGWRNVAGVFKKTQELLKSKEMIYLKMFTFKDGLDTFGAKINFDIYTLRNINNNNFLTEIICEDKSNVSLDISKMEFIPGENIKEIISLIAKDGEEKVEICGDSTYHTQHLDYMSKIETNTHIYPCVYMVSYIDVPNFWYSNKNNGHIGKSKVIWAGGSSGVIIDKIGEYGLTQFAYAIIDDSENLDNIYKALKNEKFIKKIMLFKDGLGDKYNRKIIATFRKDFWKDFLNEKECTYKK